MMQIKGKLKDNILIFLAFIVYNFAFGFSFISSLRWLLFWKSLSVPVIIICLTVFLMSSYMLIFGILLFVSRRFSGLESILGYMEKGFKACMYYLQYLLTPLMAFYLIVGMPILLWLLLLCLEVPVAYENAFMYFSYFLIAIFLTYSLKGLTRFIVVRYLKLKDDYSSLYSKLTPRLIRIYIKLFLTLSYIISNVEKFLDYSFTRDVWWIIQKNVLLEVLLTYLLITTLIDYISEHKSKLNFDQTTRKIE